MAGIKPQQPGPPVVESSDQSEEEVENYFTFRGDSNIKCGNCTPKAS